MDGSKTWFKSLDKQLLQWSSEYWISEYQILTVQFSNGKWYITIKNRAFMSRFWMVDYFLLLNTRSCIQMAMAIWKPAIICVQKMTF
jgi:hypothetical protein